MPKSLMALTVAGCCGIVVGVSKMFSVSLPEELQPERYPLMAKEAIVKCLLVDDLHYKLEHLQRAKQICASRYGHISPQHNRLLCWQARLVAESGDCGLMVELIKEMVKKPHVGEAVEDEVRRWTYACRLLQSIQNSCSDSIFEMTVNEFMTAKSRLPVFITERIKPF